MRAKLVRIAMTGATLCLIALISFPSLPSASGLAFGPHTVNRAIKGDRLVVSSQTISRSSKAQPSLLKAEKQVPVGCDRAFSSMSSAQFKNLYGRCAA
jgi:hypothetical protein